MSVSHRVLSILVLACAAILPASAATTDPASLMPPDTVLYVGWTNLMNPREQAQLNQVRQGLAALKLGEKEAALVNQLMELLPVALQGPGCVGLLDFTTTDHCPDVQAVLVLESQQAAKDLPQRLADLLAVTGEEELQARAGEPIDGVPTWRIGSPEQHWEVLWGVAGERFFVAIGEKAASRIIAQWKSEGPSLADSEELKLDRARAGCQPGSIRAESYTDVPAFIAKLRAAIEAEEGPLPPEVDRAIQGLRLNAIQSLHIHSAEVDGLPRASLFMHTTGPAEGILALFDQQPLTDDDLKLIPADAYWAVAFNLDLKKFYLNLARTVREVHPAGLAMVNAGMGAVVGAMNFTSPEQLYEMVGDTWILYDAPNQGGFIGVGTVFVAEIKNRESFSGITENVRTLVNLLAKGEVNVTAHQTTSGEHEIHYLLGGGVPCPVAPAWGFVGDRCVIGLFPQTVAVAMNQLDPATRKSSLLDNPDFAAAQSVAAPNTHAVAYLDAKGLYRLIYPIQLLLQTAGVSQLAAGGMNLDLATYPTFDESVAGVHSLVVTGGRGEDGLFCIMTGGGPGTSGKLLVGAGAVAAVGVPVAVKADHLATQNRGLIAVQVIGTACQAYAVDHNGEFPPSLGDLSNYGFERNALALPPCARITYIQSRPLAELQAPAQTVVAYVSRGDGSPIPVVFADGHAETLDRLRLEQLLREAEPPATPPADSASPVPRQA